MKNMSVETLIQLALDHNPCPVTDCDAPGCKLARYILITNGYKRVDAGGKIGFTWRRRDLNQNNWKE